jgi:hypothetical protein
MPVAVIIKKQIEQPEVRWGGFDGICPIDKSNGAADHDVITVWIDTLNNVTSNSPCPNCIPDTTNHTDNYFANYILWDYLPMNGVADNDPLFYDDISLFYNINWYDYDEVEDKYILIQEGGVLTPEGLQLRSEGKFLPFWQNYAHATETYYASIISVTGDSCESEKTAITVHITSDIIKLDDICFETYTRQSTSNMPLSVSWQDIFLEKYEYNETNQGLYWFSSEEDAKIAYLDYPDVENDVPDEDISLLEASNNDLWAFRYEKNGDACATKPLKVTINVYEHPSTVIKIQNKASLLDTICAGEGVDIVIGLLPLPDEGEKCYYLSFGNGDIQDICSDTLTPIDGIANAVLLHYDNFNFGNNILTTYRLWDDNAGTHNGNTWNLNPCFEMDNNFNQGEHAIFDDYVYADTIVITQFKKPEITGNLSGLSAFCAGETLGFPADTTFTANADTAYTKWMLGDDVIGHDYVFQYPGDNDKILKFIVINRCGSDTVSKQITVKDRPSFTEELTDYWDWMLVCEGESFEIEEKVSHYFATDYNGGTSQPSLWVISTTAGGEDPYELAYEPLDSPHNTILADNGKWIGLIAYNECGSDTIFAQFVVSENPILHSAKDTLCSKEEKILTPENGVNGNVIPSGTEFAWSIISASGDISGATDTYNGGDNINWQTEFIQTLTNNSNVASNVIYSVYAKNAACITLPVYDTVTVYPTPIATIVTPEICEDDSIAIVFIGTAPFELTYTIIGDSPLNPVDIGLPTIFGLNEVGSIWNPVTNKATFSFNIVGIFDIFITKITDAHHCESVYVNEE